MFKITTGPWLLMSCGGDYFMRAAPHRGTLTTGNVREAHLFENKAEAELAAKKFGLAGFCATTRDACEFADTMRNTDFAELELRIFAAGGVPIAASSASSTRTTTTMRWSSCAS